MSKMLIHLSPLVGCFDLLHKDGYINKTTYDIVYSHYTNKEFIEIFKVLALQGYKFKCLTANITITRALFKVTMGDHRVVLGTPDKQAGCNSIW